MDFNEISFEALFKCCEFKRYTSSKYKASTEKFYRFLEEKFPNFNIRNEIEREANSYCTAAEESGFEQGFCFAVKIIKFLNNV